jgi:2-polyprenyl-3-methyl-5-hydroxy-6-metoxy-1,4-benzoquinol methylase
MSPSAQANTPDVWNDIWARNKTLDEDIYNLEKEEHSIRWRRIENIIIHQFGKFKDLRVIEIGAGEGTNAALLAKRGAHVTILDYSDNALIRAREFFHSNNLVADFVKADALNLPSEFCGGFDISMSFGLAEHFTGEKRLKIFKSHYELLSPNGVSFVSVPNSFNLPYRIFKFTSEHMGRWNVGEEYPFSRKELTDVCRKIGITNYGFCADSIFHSFHFINPFEYLKLKDQKNYSNEIKCIQYEAGTSFDEYISYAIVLWMKK